MIRNVYFLCPQRSVKKEQLVYRYFKHKLRIEKLHKAPCKKIIHKEILKNKHLEKVINQHLTVHKEITIIMV